MSEPTLAQVDPEIASLIAKEERRQLDSIRLIASENYASRAVQEAAGSALNNKYSEGYPGKRYYQGQEYVDKVETLAIERIKKLFGVEHVNVQPYSGSPANLAVHYAFLRPGDKTVGLGLPAGGHLTHGWKVSITGDYFEAHQYGVRENDHRLDMDQVARLAREHKPKLMWCGTTAYPRHVDYAKFAEIANEVGAILVADIAHVSGLIAGKAHPSPVGLAPIVTSTTHKTLRGPRGGMILCDAKYAKEIDKAVFPGLQGGPHNSGIAALAVAAHEALQPSFETYARNVVTNAKAMAETLMSRGIDLVTGGTDTHLILADLTSKNVAGKPAAIALEKAGIVCNYNSVPFDKRKPFDPSGIRLGTPAVTSRGMGPDEMKRIGGWIADVVEAPTDEKVIARVRGELLAMCQQFPAPGLERR
ncbi:serine hydroxymethyltransferase [Sandaracinus amylolyticus]|uniref:Serine hydroxymethyltransferase n=1 Tax=Sandaracinus amylolyticus TaxID=927083 RepID=A0A0F6W492_9BACT|nr:serine hydroxymethyltransferase [Sandaracinus amylolyticus]AKF07100.1 Serine hydroxymethyltransferase [Sandaracinus amylolyticus]